ncbi:MAG: tyrosine-type recombinase/integrase, partial [Clostridiales bacterium]|nr:tyrosine-type recombinase/integrase [Clostridiales bacterium]
IQRSVSFSGNSPVIGTTKSKAGVRYIPLANPLAQTLMPFEAEEGFILGGERPITQCKFLRAWERINKTISLYGTTPHILRHSFITAAVPYVDVKTLQSIAGHADISTTAMPTGRGTESWRRGKPFRGCMEGKMHRLYTKPHVPQTFTNQHFKGYFKSLIAPEYAPIPPFPPKTL